MTDLWIPIVLVAAALQTVRNAGQKHMAGQVSPWAAAWIRFGFGLPFTFLYLWWATSWFGLELPPLAWSFWLPAVLGAVGQVTGTIFMVLLFRLRNFAVGSTYVRSEAILAAIVGTFLFAEPVSPAGWLAIILSTGARSDDPFASSADPSADPSAFSRWILRFSRWLRRFST